MYLLLKALHIFGFVAWFAGLFFLVRLFVYHTEAFDFEKVKSDILTAQYQDIEKRVYKIICTPAMLLTWICGTMMIVSNGWEWFTVNYWLHFKLILVIILSGYHHHCKSLIKKLVIGKTGFSSFQFRLWNELPSIFLLTIVLLAVFKNSLDFVKAAIGIIAFAVVIYLLARLYRNIRLKKEGIET